MPASATTSHRTTLRSFEHETSRSQPALSCSDVTAPLWPVSTTRSEPSPSRHTRTVPSAWPTASVSPSAPSSSAVTSWPPPSGARSVRTSVRCLIDHTWTASSAGATASLPEASTATWPPPETTTPQEACWA